ncbi:hypothetical protein [Micromonospora sp. NPDC049679]|uniref:hypothetical protein n=1 Tax=Micromonospora sp. NPDC049679 TaxID=3155920 RepID=UPI0033CCBD2D
MGDSGVPAGHAGAPADPVTARQAQHWLLTLLPGFPLLLLVLRLWHLSRQDLSTMLLLVQYVSPLGLVSALLITLVWVLPLSVLVVAVLGNLLWLSAPDRFDPDRSLLARATVRTPGWVIGSAALLAALTWQLRFLPTLVMMSLAALGLYTRRRYAGDRARTRTVCLVLPLIAAGVAYLWLGPAIVAAVRSGDAVTALLLIAPPALGVFLTGPVPRRAAPPLTHWVVVAGALVAPFVVGAIFLRAPILPTVAVEVADGGSPADPPATVLRGQIITVDDRMTTLLDDQGLVRFVPNDQVASKTLCPESAHVPASRVRAHGWHVEETALEWIIPRRVPGEPDPRCRGRLLTPVEPTAPRDRPATHR